MKTARFPATHWMAALLLLAGCSEPDTQVAVRNETLKLMGQVFRVACPEDESGVPNDLGKSSGIGHQHSCAAGHGLDGNVPEGFRPLGRDDSDIHTA